MDMTDVAYSTRADAQIRDLLQEWAKAVRAQDLDRIMAHYAPDVVACDAIGPLQFKGRDAYAKHWQTCFGLCPAPMAFDLRDLTVAAGDDVAFAHALVTCGPSGPENEDKTGAVRLTVCYRKIGGRWLVVHEHFSVPFDVETGQALCHLKP
jgi:uncharacterized protein (TIGR02246 family)